MKRLLSAVSRCSANFGASDIKPWTLVPFSVLRRLSPGLEIKALENTTPHLH